MKKKIILGLSLVLVLVVVLFSTWSAPAKKISDKHRVNGIIIYTEMVTENGKDYFQKAVFAYTVADSIFVGEGLLEEDFKVQYPGNEVVVEFYESDTTLSKIVESKNNYPINAKQNFSWKHEGYVSTITFINSIAFYRSLTRHFIFINLIAKHSVKSQLCHRFSIVGASRNSAPLEELLNILFQHHF